MTISLYSLDISVNKAAFNYKNSKYLEVYLQELGNTVTFKDLASLKKQASVELTILIKKDSQIYNFEKFVLNSPESDNAKDFIDIRRFKIENGNYELSVEAKDLNFVENTYYSSFNFSVNFSDKLCISDFQLLAKIEKNSDFSIPLSRMAIISSRLFSVSCRKALIPLEYILRFIMHKIYRKAVN